MRGEDEIQKMADRAASIISAGTLDVLDKTTLIAADGSAHEVERLRGIRDALDWVLDEDAKDELIT